MAYLRSPGLPAAADWEKGRAVHERFLFELATSPAVLGPLAGMIGEDIVLWGVSAIRKVPGQVHPWHCDIESSAPEGGFVSVWIGIEHTSRESALQVISRSHLIGRTVQEARHESGLPRDLATPEAMLAAVKRVEPEAELIQPAMTNGDALFFDGRMWHGSNNTRTRGQRVALLFQYAAASCPVHVPDLRHLDWPFRFRPVPRPPAILVRGTDRHRVNRLVPAPPPTSVSSAMIITAIHPLALPLDNPDKAWQPFPAFRGPTRTFTDMSCHASVLVGGHSPHAPHAHGDEEVLIPLHGEVDLMIAGSPTDTAPRVERLRPGSFVYYPAGQHHTIRNPGTAPVSYLMFKWQAAEAGTIDPLGTRIVHYGDVAVPPGAPGFWTRHLLDGATGYLGKLHAHETVLAPGGGYDPHVDAYDVAIVTLSGRVETLGQVVEPESVIYYAAGEMHGMRNTSAEPARYLVFEFHAPGVAPPQSRGAFQGYLAAAAKRLARPVWHWLEPYLPRRGP